MAGSGTLSAIVRTARPKQWVKNLFFVGAPVVFARHLGNGEVVVRATIAVAIFCALSSAVYFLNDIVDVEKDRAHPHKRHRPIASGELPVGAARAIATVLGVGSLAAAFALNRWFGGCALAYLLLNLAYSFRLKHVVYVDVLVIAGGFLLRTAAGALAIGVEASPYLLVCTGLISTFLGFGKRLHELRQAGARGITQRATLGAYRAEILEAALWITGGATLLSYVAYTRAPHTLAFFGTERMTLTSPFVAFGLVRFVSILRDRAAGESPTDEMLRDPWFMLNIVAFAATAMFVIYR